MNKVEKIEQKIKDITGEMLSLESDYENKPRGNIYKTRLKNLKKKMEYHINLIKKLGGNIPTAIVEYVLLEKESKTGTLVRVKHKTLLVDLTEEEIVKLLNIRFPGKLVGYQVKFLATGISEK